MTTKSIAVNKKKGEQFQTPIYGELWISKRTGAIYLMDNSTDGTVVFPSEEMELGKFVSAITQSNLKPFEGTVTITQEL